MVAWQFIAWKRWGKNPSRRDGMIPFGRSRFLLGVERLPALPDHTSYGTPVSQTPPRRRPRKRGSAPRHAKRQTPNAKRRTLDSVFRQELSEMSQNRDQRRE
jgi:hypothetical protein